MGARRPGLTIEREERYNKFFTRAAVPTEIHAYFYFLSLGVLNRTLKKIMVSGWSDHEPSDF